MSPWRYLRHDAVEADQGLATDEAMTAGYTRDEGDRPPTLRLYTYRDHCALVGRYQHLDAEVDLTACRRRGVSVNRRPTGGGAIIMGAGQLGVAVCTRAPVEQRPKELLQRFSEGIVAGLSRLGIDATFRGKNDLAVDGRKIAGLGLFLNGTGGLLFHASVLADLDVELMLDVLQIPAAKLGDRAAAAVGERVTTVSRELGESWDGAALREVIAAGFATALDVELQPGVLGYQEREMAARLVEQRYGTERWRDEYSPRSDATATATLRLAGGLARLYLACHDRTIKSVLFTGDFNAVPAPLVALEEQLRWKRLDRATVSAVVEGCFLGHPELGDPAAVVEALLDAADRLDDQHPTAAPERMGSCYFPEVVTAP